MPWYDGLLARMASFSFPLWEELPDLGLYMDQVITYLDRQCRPLYGDGKRIITPSMINNYVKSGLVTRPVGKKYDRDQLAQLIMICCLKQIISLEDMQLLLRTSEDGTKIAYGFFCQEVQQAVSDYRDALQALTPMQCAVQSAAHALLCGEILHGETPL